MADADPNSFAQTRAAAARAIQRRMVAHGTAGTTDMADAPLRNPASVYTDPARFAAERRILFGTLPLVAGLSGDVPNPGDRMLFDAAGPSILIMRGRDGVLRGFLNMCTHRGAKLVRADEAGRCGHGARVTCPFHAWTYDLEGRLIGLPGAAGFPGVDKAERGLIAVPVAEWHGIIFVVPKAGDAAIDVDGFLGDMGPVLASLELARAEPVRAGELRAATNWKFALDTYGEGYHFATLHASTIGQTHYNDIAVYDRFGRHHRVGFPDKSAGALAALPERAWPVTDYGGVHYVFPNTVFFIGSIEPGKGFTQVFRMFPGAAVDRMVTQFAVYAPTGVQSPQHRAECEFAYDATAQVVSTEDYVIAAEGTANLMHAPAGFEVIYGRNEIALHNVHRSIAAAIAMPIG